MNRETGGFAQIKINLFYKSIVYYESQMINFWITRNSYARNAPFD